MNDDSKTLETKWINLISGKLPTYPSPKPTLSLTSHLRQNVGLGGGGGGGVGRQFPRHLY